MSVKKAADRRIIKVIENMDHRCYFTPEIMQLPAICRLWHFGNDHWIQDSLCYFLCLLATLRIPFSIFCVCWQHYGIQDWWTFIFRVWTQGAIGYTASRLNRLFHALQSSHSGGLRSWSASCLVNMSQLIYERWLCIYYHGL